MDKIRKVFIFQPFKRDGNETWYGLIKEGRKRILRISLRTKSRRDADLWKRKQEAQRFLPKENVPSAIEAKSIDDAVAHHKAFLEGVYGNSPATLSAYSNYLEKYRLRFSGRTTDSITVKDAQDMISDLSTNYAAKTVDEIFKFGNNMFERWKKYKFIENNPFSDDSIILPKIIREERAFWLPEEIVDILENRSTPNNKAFWAVQAYGGLRFEEAHSLPFEKIDFERNRMTIEGKGNKTRTVPLNPYLQKILREEKAKYKYGRCFPMVLGTEGGCLKELKRLLKGMRFKIQGPATFHRFRHSFASNLLRKGANIKDVQILLGHSDIGITLDIYGHLVDGDLAKTVNLL